jgi:hypothetical protein
MKLVAVLLAAILVVLCIATWGTSVTPRPSWEYRVVSFDDDAWDKPAQFGTDSKILARPNDFGLEGWEIVSARRASDSLGAKYECIVKRRK